jgi:hypothetical protein
VEAGQVAAVNLSLSSMPISFGGFMPEPLGEPSRDQCNATGRSASGSVVHLFEQPVIELERDLRAVATLLGFAGARSPIAVHGYERLAFDCGCRFAPRSIAAISETAGLPLITVPFGVGFGGGLLPG